MLRPDRPGLKIPSCYRRVLADSKIYRISSFVDPETTEIRLFETLNRADLHWADCLLVRSHTCVVPMLLAGTEIRLVGTASSGTDHVMLPSRRQPRLKVCSAHGCNARAVAEYVASAALLFPEYFLSGIVRIQGYGPVGQHVALLLDYLGYTVEVIDPFVDQGFIPEKYRCDPSKAAEVSVLSLHMNLHRGKSSTWNWWSSGREFAYKNLKLLMILGRGRMRAQNFIGKKRLQIIQDVWRGEPNISRADMDEVMLATPHLAGYSYEAKFRATTKLIENIVSTTVRGGSEVFDGEEGSARHHQKLQMELHPKAAKLSPIPLLEWDGSLREVRGACVAGRFLSIREKAAQRREWGVWTA